MQWHPERNQFEWNPKLHINHSAPAIEANAWTAFDFVNEVRRHRLEDRNWPLLRKFSTYSMRSVPAGDSLDGQQYLVFGGFGAAGSMDLEKPVIVV
eukprot:gnl/TRDRNA2_/TRDRNA2_168252_c1_seq1.p2 gnl/TRDRNA2_/TRDRNA2_168252_c1~~gnl/TRDRNA2_/TRDRNA2_168252_c1_seq1.p2  ORF type:complete len:110 (+),score=16.50 gnl/TRDRNA2_/TRDRNA2_168252_c1_seq1:45-332(+)